MSNPNQARDENGRFTSTGGSGGGHFTRTLRKHANVDTALAAGSLALSAASLVAGHHMPTGVMAADKALKLSHVLRKGAAIAGGLTVAHGGRKLSVKF